MTNRSWTIESIASKRGREPIRLDKPDSLRRWLAGESMRVKRDKAPVLYAQVSDVQIKRALWS